MQFLLTGGHSGIGLELSKMLLKDGHRIGLILRSEKRKADALATLGQDAPIDFFFADLSKDDDIKQAVEAIKGSWDRIDGLFNNAGVLMDQAYYSEQGNEMHFEVNTLTPYFLTSGLMPLLENADKPFVINTATGSMHSRTELDIPDLKKPKKFVRLVGSYMASKHAMVMLMNWLGAQHSTVRVLSVNPGPNKTPMTGGSGMPRFLLPIRNLFFPPPTKGAKFLYDAAFDPKFEGQSGVFISSNKVLQMKRSLTDEEAAEMLAGRVS